MDMHALPIPSLGHLVGLALLTSLVVLFGICVQRVYFHPLSRYPGPFLAKVTDLYAAYHAWRGDIHIDMWKQHQRYGRHVRYAPEKLNIDTSRALTDIYIGTGKNFQKSPNYRVLRHGAANTLTMINHQEHARRRRIISQGVSDNALRVQEPLIMENIKKCFAHVAKPDAYASRSPDASADQLDVPLWTGSRNMSDWLGWLTFDIMSGVVFGKRYDLLGSTTHRVIPKAIEESNVRVSTLLQSPGLRQIGRIDRWLFPKSIEARGTYLSFVGELMRQLMSPDSVAKTGTVMTALKSAVDPETGEKLSAKELMAESTTLVVAGADTSSTAMAAIFYYLADTPRAYRRLQKEIRDAFQSSEEIAIGPKMNSLSYLRACIDEGLRMAPPTGSSLFREVRSEGAIVDDCVLPPGVQVGVPIYAIHHNTDYFHEPFQYLPERWLVDEPDNSLEKVERARSAFCPFSLGMRGCVGKGMAMMELKLAVAYAMWNFDFDFADIPDDTDPALIRGLNGEFRLRDHITASKW